MPETTIRRRIYYDDTDGGGVVYHTNYLKYMEHARSEFLNERNYAPWRVSEEFKVIFAVADLTIRYLAPARLGDELAIRAEVRKVAGATVYFDQSIWLLDSESGKQIRELASADVRIVCLDTEYFKPARIPAPLQESMLSEC